MEVVVQGATLPDPDVELGRMAGDTGRQATRGGFDVIRAGVRRGGLYDVNTDPKTGERVPVYTMCTVPPNEFLGTVHDRAPMVLLPFQYAAWLAGGAEALQLVATHPDAGAFNVDVVA